MTGGTTKNSCDPYEGPGNVNHKEGGPCEIGIFRVKE